ncbi:MAG: HD domain-containing protein [Desulfobacterales bacterium]|nr:HD domain-containing protein [Desulfobacterales bacterium]
MILPSIPKTVIHVLEKLKKAGFQAYIVGGAVRDACLKRPITDWDVATSASPEKIKSVFQDTRYFALKHDTVTLVYSGCQIEVTTFRRDINTLQEDLGHRDFTINSMAYDPDNDRILDPFKGKADIAGKLIRAVGDADARFSEDPLRLLRAVRLANELGFHIDEETRNALANKASMLSSVAHERIREELMLILVTPRPSTGFNILLGTGLLKVIFPELLEGYLKRQNAYHRYTIFKHIMETVDSVKPIPMLRLVALFHDIAKPRVRKKVGKVWRFFGHEEASAILAKEIMARFRFSREIIRNVTNLIKHHMINYNSNWSDGAVRRLIQRVGSDQVMNLLIFRRADIQAHDMNEKDMDLLHELEKRIIGQLNSQISIEIKDLALDGHKVMKVLGLSAGPKVGEILRDLLEKVVDHPELNNEEGLMALLEKKRKNFIEGTW